MYSHQGMASSSESAAPSAAAAAAAAAAGAASDEEWLQPQPQQQQPLQDEQPPTQRSQPHIRPRVKKSATPSTAVVNQQQQQQQQQPPPHLGPACSTTTAADAQLPPVLLVKGILRSSPKYSSSTTPRPSDSSSSSSLITAAVDPMEAQKDKEEPSVVGSSVATPGVSAPDDDGHHKEEELVIVERRTRRRKQGKKKVSETKTQPPNEGKSQRHDPTRAMRPPETSALRSEASERAESVASASTVSDDDNDNQDPLVFHTLYEMMEHAGTLPRNVRNDNSVEGYNDSCDARGDAEEQLVPGSVVEADLEFQCMDPDTWRKVQRVQQPIDEKENVGTRDEFSDDEPPLARGWLTALTSKELEEASTASGDTTSNVDDESDDDLDDEYHDFLQSIKDERRNNDDYYSSEGEDDGEENQETNDDEDEHGDRDGSDRVHRMAPSSARPSTRSPSVAPTAPVSSRPFLTLWKALMQWVTPQAARYLCTDVPEGSIRPFEPILDADNDVVASRLGGLYAQIQMHVAPALAHLQFVDNPRLAWIRLGDLLRCFSYGQPMPDLDRRHLRALTVVLLHAVLRNQPGFRGDKAFLNAPAPEPCTDLGLTVAEYLHLTKVLAGLGSDDDDDDGDVVVEDPYVNSVGAVNVPRPKNGYH